MNALLASVNPCPFCIKTIESNASMSYIKTKIFFNSNVDTKDLMNFKALGISFVIFNVVQYNEFH